MTKELGWRKDEIYIFIYHGTFLFCDQYDTMTFMGLGDLIRVRDGVDTERIRNDEASTCTLRSVEALQARLSMINVCDAVM